MQNPLRVASQAAGACALALAFLAPVQAAPVLEMSTATSATGIDLIVRARDVQDLHAYQFTLNFSPALLTAWTVTEGSFLQGGGNTYFEAGDIDNATGSISWLFNTLIGPVDGVDGSGDLATFSFSIDRGGFANFSLSDVLFLDSAGNDIAVDYSDLVAQVGEVPEPASLWLASLGLAALLGGRKLRRRTR